jgi:hypothetical protein
MCILLRKSEMKTRSGIKEALRDISKMGAESD